MADEEDNVTHRDILQSIKELTKSLESAFPKDDEDKPDYSGHRMYHKQLKESIKEQQAARSAIIRNIVSWLAIGALTIIGSSLVQAFLLQAASSPLPK